METRGASKRKHGDTGNGEKDVESLHCAKLVKLLDNVGCANDSHRQASGDDSEHRIDAMDIQMKGKESVRLSSAKGKGKGKAPEVRVPRKARLAFMMNMPQDIFCIVAGCLSPLDLLHIARASKALRALLFSRSSRPIWRASRMGLLSPLPDGPEDLSEPLYATLIFERGCFGCKAVNAKNVYFALRKRFCKSCAKKFIGTPKYPSRVVFQLVPFTSFEGHAADFEEADVNKFVLYGYYTLVADFENMIQSYEAILKEGKKKAKVFIVERRVEVKRVMDHAKKIGRWLLEQKAEKIVERHNLGVYFYREICDRLQNMGYTFSLISAEDFDIDSGKRWNQLVSQPKMLTEKVWSKLYPKLQDILHARETNRNEHHQAIVEIFEKYEFHLIYDDVEEMLENLEEIIMNYDI